MRQKRKKEEHPKLVSFIVVGAEREAGLLHKITKPTAWRGGVQVLEEEEEKDVRTCNRRKEQRHEWTQHKPWRNEELRSLEEGLPVPKEKHMEKAAKSSKAATGVICDGFHSQSSIRFVERNERRNCGILRASGTVWQMSATSLHNDVFSYGQAAHCSCACHE